MDWTFREKSGFLPTLGKMYKHDMITELDANLNSTTKSLCLDMGVAGIWSRDGRIVEIMVLNDFSAENR